MCLHFSSYPSFLIAFIALLVAFFTTPYFFFNTTSPSSSSSPLNPMSSVPSPPAQPLSALVLGATGAVGKELVRELLKSGNFRPVTIIGRRPLEYSGPNEANLVQHTVDFEKLEDHADLFTGHDVLFCSLGTTRAIAGSAEAFVHIDQGYVLKAAKLAKAAWIKHFVYVSSVGASSSSFFLYPKTKGQTEDGLKSIGFPRLSILRPAFLKTVEPRERPRGVADFFTNHFVPVLDTVFGEARISASVTDVAKAMIRSAESAHASVGSQDNGEKEVNLLVNKDILELAHAYSSSSSSSSS
ncbi:MAG: hypothetical protein DHS80DRAFT_25964 [Piptocephalis tieghemiana]|nr:MAG: hypothetical protein DHS80DRAFT_25964 [Piptocephalis tieghemiana]